MDDGNVKVYVHVVIERQLRDRLRMAGVTANTAVREWLHEHLTSGGIVTAGDLGEAKRAWEARHSGVDPGTPHIATMDEEHHMTEEELARASAPRVRRGDSGIGVAGGQAPNAARETVAPPDSPAERPSRAYPKSEQGRRRG